jgi:hypothetical protein
MLLAITMILAIVNLEHCHIVDHFLLSHGLLPIVLMTALNIVLELQLLFLIS